ncbi:hypothetical protein CHU95_00745 [Niveispirillum lacus]|uniref:DUF218 domain-containing protein n=1 Tax=Niveispirillum lacus TaxID=1981099 RepID=A0A255Z8H3_9PROT|nr:YdcF family protein [Niveispirillum lacus]OYQ37721.1 hypothetical protein CHU95_00745 [Niveispirillum lacus]
MGFGLGKLLAALTSPGNLLLLLLLTGLVLIWRGRPVGRRLILTATIGFLLIATTPLSIWLLIPLEQRFATPDLSQIGPVDGIIVLGGALMPIGSREHGAPQLNRDAERLTVLPGLMRQFPDAAVLFTGGSGDPRTPGEREAPFVTALLAGWGADTSRVQLEGASRNTWENAVNSAPFLTDGGRWLLVTSAAHMPRAIGVFRAAIPTTTFIAYPVGFNANRAEALRFGLNLSENLDRTEIGAHEWRGLLTYWLAGRIPAILPAP